MRKSVRDVSDLLAIGVKKELVNALSVEEANDLLKSLLLLKEEYQEAIAQELVHHSE